MVIALQLLASLAAFLPTTIPANLSYPAVFNFGDSNSDTGGLNAGIAFPIKRFCNGYLIIDYLMNEMDLPFLNPYLDSVGAPSFQTGCNFATGGSTVLPANAALISPFSFGIQVAQFGRFKAKALELLSKDKKLQNVLPFEDYFKQGLYTFDVGHNDLDGAFSLKSEDQVVAFIPSIMTDSRPEFRSTGMPTKNYCTFGKNPSQLDQFGCVASHNRAATAFNAQLRDLCFKFQRKFPEANVTYINIYKIKLDLITNYAQYGFKQGIAACCGYGGLPLNFDNRINCGETKNLNGTLVTATHALIQKSM
ncbi:GDSL-like Lipase/Acylhydrolase superfamily protein [Prunus dulcis]|uniref:GDSL-like Lipase/Acylhydrolase superfamily protein n=1 Tax=Prunus dulcis TaxID=3755 RepID=A0A4Y1S2F6_PRUDU|nr:GDSL-like Lipase/Acylhydrolase superfamily protein [Prunus dulcis]